MAALCRERIDPSVEWVTFVPSERHPDLVPMFARQLAAELSLPVHEVIGKLRSTAPQKEMQNSATQLGNIWGAFGINEDLPDGPCLLVDDVIDSRWTVTVLSSLLRRHGSGPVFPVALAYAGQSDP